MVHFLNRIRYKRMMNFLCRNKTTSLYSVFQFGVLKIRYYLGTFQDKAFIMEATTALINISQINIYFISGLNN